MKTKLTTLCLIMWSMNGFSQIANYDLSTNLNIAAAYHRYQPLALDWQFDNTNSLTSGLSFF